MREAQTEVLVVGAGPVGLWAAVLLAQAGVQVIIIDQERRTATRSYACALHPATLSLLKRANVLEPILAQSRHVPKMAFYDGLERKVELPLSVVSSEFPFLAILPQSVLEGELEDRLRQKGVRVQWNHRFESLSEEPEMVSSEIQELGGTGTGYIVPHWETVVKSSAPLLTQFVLGADGYNSRVRQALRIDYERLAGATSFAAFEFETDQAIEPEVRVVLSDTTNVLWPISEQKCRWTFQIVRSELEREFPQKERRSARLVQTNVDERIRRYVEKVAGQRAPWFKGSVKEIGWCTEVSFEQRLARQFGRNRCWLLGDAAHQTGPAGVQSMNSGFAEAEALTKRIISLLRQEGGTGQLGDYQPHQMETWKRLLGGSAGLKPGPHANDWVAENSARILPCLPGCGPDAVRLAAELNLQLG